MEEHTRGLIVFGAGTIILLVVIAIILHGIWY